MVNRNDSFEQNIIKQCFKDRSVLLYVLECVDKDDMFADPVCSRLWKIFLSINKEGFNLNLTAVSDVIKFSGDENLQEAFNNIINTEYEDESEWKYHLYVVQENYKKNILMNICNTINAEIHDSSSEEILNNINNDIMELQTTGTKTTSFGNACLRALEDIRDINDGKKQSYLKTGNARFDELVALSAGKFLLVASLAKIGKSRWVIDLADRLISNNERVNIQWYSFEMKASEVLNCFIGRKLKLDNYVLSGKRGKISGANEANNGCLQLL